MNTLPINISINECIYLKDPQSSNLGKNIISTSIKLIVELGFESFTFKKLGEAINSNESSIYRYFENKYYLLVYLMNWYWSWMEYQILLYTTSIEDPQLKLEKTIHLLTKEVTKDNSVSFVDEILLFQIIINESTKAYYIKDVDNKNKKGFYKPYKSLVHRVCQILLDYCPGYKNPHMLISTVIEGSHHQHYFRDHLPSLTDESDIVSFYRDLVLNTIKP